MFFVYAEEKLYLCSRDPRNVALKVTSHKWKMKLEAYEPTAVGLYIKEIVSFPTPFVKS